MSDNKADRVRNILCRFNVNIALIFVTAFYGLQELRRIFRIPFFPKLSAYPCVLREAQTCANAYKGAVSGR